MLSPDGLIFDIVLVFLCLCHQSHVAVWRWCEFMYEAVTVFFSQKTTNKFIILRNSSVGCSTDGVTGGKKASSVNQEGGNCPQSDVMVHADGAAAVTGCRHRIQERSRFGLYPERLIQVCCKIYGPSSSGSPARGGGRGERT